MLTEYEGTIDSQGLCNFQQSRQARPHSSPPQWRIGRVPFWAVLEADSANEILRELNAGGRDRALRLLEELAISLGTQWE